MTRNKIITAIAVLSLAGILTTSCGSSPRAAGTPRPATTQLPAAARPAPVRVTVQIAVPPPKSALRGLRTRRVNLSDIAFVDVRATHPGGIGNTAAKNNPIAVANNQATAELELTVGPNQLLTVSGLDARKQPIPGATVRGVVSVAAGGNPVVSINAGTTPTANVLDALYTADPILASKVDAATLQNLITLIMGTAPSATAPSLIDARYIADEIARSNGAVPLAPTPAMTQQAGTVTVRVLNAVTDLPIEGASVVVGDPLSALGTTNADGNAEIPNVAPGFWMVIAGGTTVPVDSGEVIVTAGRTAAANPAPTAYTPQQTPNQTVTQTIGSAGGTIEVPGVLKLTIPAGALPENQTFRLSTYADADPTRFYGFRIEPVDLHFNGTAATLLFHYTDEQLRAWGITDPAARGQLLISQFRPSGVGLPRQALVPATIDPAARTVSARLTQTGVAANPGIPTVQGFRVKSGGPTDGTNGNLTNALLFAGSPDVDLEFSPTALALRIATNTPDPASVPLDGVTRFTADVTDAGGAAFDHTPLALTVTGRMLRPDNSDAGPVSFALDQATSTATVKRFSGTSGANQLTTPGIWTLTGVKLSSHGTVAWSAGSQQVAVSDARLLILATDATWTPAAFQVAGNQGWDQNVIPGALWIWDQTGLDDAGSASLSKSFGLSANATNINGTIRFAADDVGQLYVNGQLVGTASTNWGGPPEEFDISNYLHAGQNTITLTGQNTSCNCGNYAENPSGLIAKATITYQ